ncbi:MAG: S-layer homology domain-containing protein, partial [Tumebacillaceae bacterium]
MKVRQRMKQLAKQWCPLILGGTMIFGLGAQAEAATTSFSDVNSSYWGYSYIMDLSSKGIAQGSEGKFYPENNVSRAEFAKLLVSALNLPLSTDVAPDFSDVSNNAWYFQYVKTAFKANIIHGVSATQFAPNDPISREDMLVMLANAQHLQTIPPELLGSVLSAFSDTDTIKDYARNAVALGKELQLVSGTPSGEFQPLASTTRAQAAVVIDRMLQLPTDRLQALQDPAFHPTGHLAVSITPSQQVPNGQQAQVQINVLNANNEPMTIDQPLTVNLSTSSADLGTLIDQTVTIPQSGVATTTFNASMTKTGDVTITAQPTVDQLKNTISGSNRLTVYSQNAAKLVSGKGMWMMWSDWHSNNTDNLLAV